MVIDAAENIGQLHEAFFQLQSLLAQRLRHHAALKTVSGLFIFVIAHRSKLGQFATGGKDKALLFTQAADQGRDLLHQAAHLALQLVLRVQAGQVFSVWPSHSAVACRRVLWAKWLIALSGRWWPSSKM